MTTASPIRPRPGLARRVARVRSSEIRDLLRVVGTSGMLSLAGGLPAPESLPTARVQRALATVLDRTGAAGPIALQYGPTEGLDELRAVVAPGTAGSPAVGAAEQVVVTTGSQQAIGLVVRALVDPGSAVVVEDPLYLGTRQVLDACRRPPRADPRRCRRARRRPARRRAREGAAPAAGGRGAQSLQSVGRDAGRRASRRVGRSRDAPRLPDPRGRPVPRARLRRPPRPHPCGRTHPITP